MGILKARLLLFFVTSLSVMTSYGCAASNPLSQIWVGMAPFCSASQEDCRILGLEYIRSDTSGDGVSCLTGEKVLCQLPKLHQSAAASGRATDFTVVQYNIMDRPFWVGHDGQRERVCRIPQALVRNITSQEPVDVLVINEGFMQVCLPHVRLTDLLASHGWPYHLPPISAWWKPSNGGVFVASKWPITFSASMAYRACRGADCLAAKGVQYARVEKRVDGRSKLYHVFGTHLQAWGGAEAAEVRRRQAREIVAFVERQEIPPTEPVILAGDMNTRGPGTQLFEELLATLKMSMPIVVGARRATMDVDNTLFGRGPWLVDYVLLSTLHQQSQRATVEVLALKAEGEFAICVEAPLQPFYVRPDASTCTRTRRVRDLSDHYPVIGRFTFTH